MQQARPIDSGGAGCEEWLAVAEDPWAWRAQTPTLALSHLDPLTEESATTAGTWTNLTGNPSAATFVGEAAAVVKTRRSRKPPGVTEDSGDWGPRSPP
ncbi:hypothetical protein NDU88_002119 [Pleurodeles waltl]|uniref:Uncharacterized protein n=1 Tax=Pleurodeles waltl TaxID=8319 RepID=A0AAV7Q514_PLEWA|nr:hypothetical protein NDU88_002119 [Pleurodeles waltl]